MLLNEIAWSYRAIGAKVWMLDLGRSFEKLCRVCDGQMIEFRASATINVNPFSAVTDIHDDMAMLQPVVARDGLTAAGAGTLRLQGHRQRRSSSPGTRTAPP